MKKLLLTTLVVAGLGLSAQGAFANSSPAQHGTITIKGKIVDVTCTINEGQPNISVALPTISKTAFTGQGDTKGDTSFEINLTGCSKKGDGEFSDSEKIYCLLHYPPTTPAKLDTGFTNLIEKYGVCKVVYGHLHAKKNPELLYEKNGIQYYLTSCDMVGQQLVLIDKV